MSNQSVQRSKAKRATSENTRPRRADDAEVGQLLRHAAESLARVQAHQPKAEVRVPTPSRSTGPVVVLALLLAFVVPIALAASYRFRDQEPAFLTNAEAFVHTGHANGEPSSGRFFVTSVRTPVVAGASLARGRESIRLSAENAFAAALRCAGRSADHERVSFETLGHTGASAGLIYALQIVDALDARDLTNGRRIAGTGTIAADGTVGPILAIALKAHAAEQSHSDLFIVPHNQVAEAHRAAASLRVVGVRTLDQAIRALTREAGCVGLP